MRGLRNRVAGLEGTNRRSLTIFAIERFDEDGPHIGTAWVDGTTVHRHEGESEADFNERVAQHSRRYRRRSAGGRDISDQGRL